MKDITRVHIAKIAYDIELSAKKELEKYLSQLEDYTNDSDVYEDIEIRVTELLAEHNINPGGVISLNEIEMLRRKLGEPHEFSDDQETSIASAGSSTRKLYRSTDDVILGGVLSGIAGFFRVDAVWIRIAYIVLFVASFGLALIAYIILWLLIPPAQTATQKLQLSGISVNAETIKDLNQGIDKSQPRTPILQVVFALSLGIGAVIGAVVSLCVAVWLILAATLGYSQLQQIGNDFVGLESDSSAVVISLIGVVVVGLLLLSCLFSLIAYASFTKTINKKIITSAVVIIVLGVLSVLVFVIGAATQSALVSNQAQSMVRETKTDLPTEFSQVEAVSIGLDKPSQQVLDRVLANPAIRYISDNGPARYELTALPGAKPHVEINGKQATITLDLPADSRYAFVQPLLTVYGPALRDLTLLNDGSNLMQTSYESNTKSSLRIRPQGNEIVLSGTFEQVSVEGSGSADMSAASVTDLSVKSEQNLAVVAATVNSLMVTHPTVCPSFDSETSKITVEGVSSGKIIYNGNPLEVKSHKTNCSEIELIKNEDEF